jgi:hypothetical protein
MQSHMPSMPSMPFTFGNGTSKTMANISGNFGQSCSQTLFSTPTTQPTQPTDDDSEDDFPICQAPKINPMSTNSSQLSQCIPLPKQFATTHCMQQRLPQSQSQLQSQSQSQSQFCNLGSNIQYGQTKSNQLLYVHLKNMRAQVEQANMMIDSLYQILSQPHILNKTQVEQIYTQINTMRDSILANNNSINEIYHIMSTT